MSKRADYETKTEENKNKLHDHDKCITANDFNKFLGTIFDEILKEAKLATNNDFNTAERHDIRNNIN